MSVVSGTWTISNRRERAAPPSPKAAEKRGIGLQCRFAFVPLHLGEAIRHAS